jgi:hypothetical protein
MKRIIKMTLTIRQKIIIIVVYTAACVAGGRYLAPTKIKTEIKTVTVTKEVESKKVDQDITTHEKTTTTETDKPDGTKTIITVKEDVSNDKTNTDDKKSDDTFTTVDKTKEVTKETSKLKLSALAGVNVTNVSGGFVYGGEVSKDILGPISIGIFGMSNGVAGCSIGISF